MKLTPLDIQRQEFRQRFRGLDPDEVRAFLSLVAEEMEQLRSENEKLTSMMATQDQINRINDARHGELKLRVESMTRGGL